MRDCEHKSFDAYESYCKRCGESAEEIVREQQARIKELEAENQRLRDALVKIRDLEYKNTYESAHGIAVQALLGGGDE